MVYKALLWTDIFWISYIKWEKFYNNNLSFVLGSKQGGSHSHMRLFYVMKSNLLYNVFILKYFSMKYKYRTLHGGYYYIITKNKTTRKRKTNILWKIVLSSFSIFHTKILYMTKYYFLMRHSTKNMMRANYA